MKIAWAIAPLALASGILASGGPAWAQGGVQVGTLSCHVSSGWGFVFGSSKAVRCTFARAGGRPEHYGGSINKFGVDIGYTQGGVLIWGVLAPSANLARGDCQGITSAPPEVRPSGSASAPMSWSAAPIERSRCSRSASRETPASMSRPASARSACATNRRSVIITALSRLCPGDAGINQGSA